MIGTTVSRFRILEKLGEGGMGVVCRAEDIQLKHAVRISQKAELSFNSLLSDVPFTALLKKIGLEK